MTRILSGGGKDSSGSPTTAVRGRPGFGSVARGFRQAVRRLAISDPADGILNANIRDVPKLGLGGYASYTTSLTGANNDLVFTAKEQGDEDVDIRIRYVDPAAANQPLSVSVSGRDITVNLATNGSSVITSTGTQVMNAVNAHAAAKLLVTASLAASNSGAGVVTAMGFQTLVGGSEGEMRQALPPGLAAPVASPGVSGREDQAPSFPPIERTATVRVSDRGANRSLRKR